MLDISEGGRWGGAYRNSKLIPDFVEESHFSLHILLRFFPESDLVGLFEADGCGFLERGDGGVTDLGDIGNLVSRFILCVMKGGGITLVCAAPQYLIKCGSPINQPTLL